MTVLGTQASAEDTAPRRPGGYGWQGWQMVQVEHVAALAITFVLGLRYSLSPDVPIGFLLAGGLLPVTVVMMRRHRGAYLICLLALAAAVSGLVLTWFAAGHGLADHSRAIVQTARVLGLGLGTLALLWARSVVGTRKVVLVYGLGVLAHLFVVGMDPRNHWKFSYSVPVTLIVLSLPFVYRRRWVEMAALGALAGMSVLNDSRSAAAMMLIAAALVVTQGTPKKGRRTHSVMVLVRLVLIAVAGFYLVQALILEGTLGESARERTIEQSQTSGSVLLGGRPELGASFELITHRPQGYGAGTLASVPDVNIAKTGMASLGYDPNNGYVEIYMLGDGIEVHSLLGDLWILFGIPGALLAFAVLGYAVYGLARAMSERVASGVLLFLVIRLVWDFAFSPFPSAMETLMLALALALPLVPTRPRDRRLTTSARS
jgi:hypothetical protein